jgi:hypothetical protein
MAWDANDAARARWIVPLSRARPVAEPLKKVTSLLLFTAEKFAAVDDKLTKKALFPVGARFSRRSAETWLSSLLVYGVRFVASKLFIVAKTMRIMISLIIKPRRHTL